MITPHHSKYNISATAPSHYPNVHRLTSILTTAVLLSLVCASQRVGVGTVAECGVVAVLTNITK